MSRQELIDKYGTEGTVKTKTLGELPIINLKMMSDERCQELAAELAIQHYTEHYGHKPASIEEAFVYQREMVASWGAVV